MVRDLSVAQDRALLRDPRDPDLRGAIVATSGRLRPGTRWVQLRGSSESLKREIYCYRVRAGAYDPEQTKETSPEAKFAEEVGSAIDSLMRTEANLVALDPDADRKAARRKRLHLPRSVDDAGQVGGEAAAAGAAKGRECPGARVSSEKLTALTPGGYVRSRLDDQAGWYLDNAARLSRDSRMLQLLAILFGAIGTVARDRAPDLGCRDDGDRGCVRDVSRDLAARDHALEVQQGGRQPWRNPVVVVRAHARRSVAPVQHRQARRRCRSGTEGRAEWLGPGDAGRDHSASSRANGRRGAGRG